MRPRTEALKRGTNMNRSRWIIAILIALVALLALGRTAGAQDGPTMTLSPESGLADGDTVTVTLEDGCLVSTTVYESLPAPSVTAVDPEDSVIVTPGTSLSVMFTVTELGMIGL